jgi:putative transcriptional regulator
MGQLWSDELHQPGLPESEDAMSDDTAADFPSVAGHLLIAMPSLLDPHFGGSVVLMADHSPKGAMGLVLNRPSDMTLSNLFGRIDLSLDANPLESQPVMVGGPVQPDRGFVLHEPIGEWSSTLNISNGLLGLTSSRDILEATAKGKGPERLLVALGYSGWSAGQLDAELASNSWLTVPMHDTAWIFETQPEERLGAAFRILGVDPLNLSGAVGHA